MRYMFNEGACYRDVRSRNAAPVAHPLGARLVPRRRRVASGRWSTSSRCAACCSSLTAPLRSRARWRRRFGLDQLRGVSAPTARSARSPRAGPRRWSTGSRWSSPRARGVGESRRVAITRRGNLRRLRARDASAPASKRLARIAGRSLGEGIRTGSAPPSCARSRENTVIRRFRASL